MAYQPKQGDIIDIDFSPVYGHEQKGRRPAVIIWGNDTLEMIPGLALICPITTTDNGFPLHIKLDKKSKKTKGFIECEQCRVVDLKARSAKLRDTVSFEVLQEVKGLVILSITD